MGPCDLKTTGQAYNDAVDAFKKAFMSSGGKIDQSLRFAISETKKNYPDINFDHETLTGPIIESLKKVKVIPENYSFGTKASKNKKKNDNKIGELAKRISDGYTKERKPPKESTLSKEDKELRAHINSKYGTYLTDENFNELMEEEVDGQTVREIVTSRVAEEKAEKLAVKEAAAEQKEIEREIAKAESEVARKIQRVADRMTKLSPNQRKDLARELVDAFVEDGILDDSRVKDIYAKVADMPHMTPELDGLINKIVDNNSELDNVEAEIRAAQKDITSNPDKYKSSEQQTAAISNAHALNDKRNALRVDAIKNAKDLALQLEKKGYWIDDFADQIQLGLMGVKSLIKNATGVVPDAIIRHLSGGTSSVINLMLRPFTGVNSNPFGARFRGGVKKYREALRDAGLALKYKQKHHSQVPNQDYMNAGHTWKKAVESHGYKKVLLSAAAAMKISPDVVSRVLLATDAIPKSLAYNGELARIADVKGMKGAEKELFMINPDSESQTKALEYAMDVTFESEFKVPFTDKKISLSFDHRAAAEKMIKNGADPITAHTKTALLKIAMNLNIPFVKVPLNILRKAGRLATPELTIIKGGLKMYKMREKPWADKQEVMTDAIGEAVVGYYVRMVALQMITSGLMSAGYDDEEKATKDNIEKRAGGTNRINRTALMRVMFLGKKAENKNGDVWVPNTFFGAFGITMGGYAHAFNMLSREEMKQYADNFTSTFKPQIAFKSAWGAANAALDNPFFTGTNNIIKAITDKEGDKASKMMINYAGMLGGGILPASYQKFSQSTTPEMVRRYDKEKTFSENLTTELGYKFSFQSKGFKKNYFSLATKEEGALKMKKTILFDNYFGRVLYENFSTDSHEGREGTPDAKLYEAGREMEMAERGELFPKAIEPKIRMTVSGKKRNIKLTDEQHEYLQEKASTLRMLAATPYIMSNDFDKSNYATRVTKLQRLYDEGLDMAIKMTKKRFPEIKKQNDAESHTNIDKKDIDKKIVNKRYK